MAAELKVFCAVEEDHLAGEGSSKLLFKTPFLL